MSALLPKPNTPWPPQQVERRYAAMGVPDAWYSGDSGRLRSAYGVKVTSQPARNITTTNPGGGAVRNSAVSGDSFWADAPGMERDTRRHLPVAQDISTMSADLLFSEPPSWRVMGPVGLSGDTKGEPTLEARAAQQRLDRVLDKCNFVATLLAAAETASALGSVGLRIAYDKLAADRGVRGRPTVTRVDADAVIPYYSWGQLVAVAFWTTVYANSEANEVWRLIELHEDGKTWPALYKGSSDNLGERKALTEREELANLAAAVGPDGAIVIDAAGGRTATSIPNMLPDPMDRQNGSGRSDYTLPVLDLFDAIDKLYTQFMDEVDDAKSRLFIADSLLSRNGPGQASSFDPDQRLYRQVNVPPSEEENGKLPIEKVQFALRVEEYFKAIDGLTAKAIDAAGYNPNTERDERTSAMTATEYSGRNRRSMTTRDKKIRYWQGELEELLTTLLRVDVDQFSPFEQVDGQTVKVKAYPVEVQWPEAVQPTQLELAQTAKALKEAGESVLEIQRVLHPDWSERQLAEAAGKLEAAASVVDPVSFGQFGQGVGAGDGA